MTKAVHNEPYEVCLVDQTGYILAREGYATEALGQVAYSLAKEQLEAGTHAEPRAYGVWFRWLYSRGTLGLYMPEYTRPEDSST